MKQNALVTETHENGTATVTVLRQSACSACSARHACGSAKKTVSTVNNPLEAKPGDTVEIEVPSDSVIKYAALVFLAPVLLALALYLPLSAISEPVGVIGALAGFVIPFIAAYFISKANADKVRPTVTAILGDTDAGPREEKECDLRNE
ncbi:MAG: SoxR reducing system RseC family protein [Clostridia bacterium]|nr:SoxR reducing system RseC family protein [Clostridia bacterium]